jgi:dihydroorotate dehydrogenase
MLSAILKAMRDKRERLRERHGRNVALVVKISPDGDDAGLRIIADVTRRERADGIVATNTTVSREGVERLPQAKEEGGLSGAPLFRRSTEVLRRLAQLVKGEIPLIGCGGVMSGADARAKFEAGASLVQIYSGLVFRGPQLIPECVSAYQRK